MKVKDDYIRELNIAIGIQGMWNHKVINSIKNAGDIQFLSNVGDCETCKFRKWVYNELDNEFKSSAYYPELLKLHKDIHIAADKAAKLFLEGKKKEAVEVVKMGGEFGIARRKLTNFLLERKKYWEEQE